MKTHRKLILLLILGIVSAGLFAGCNKSMFHHGPEKKAEWIVEEISEELDLNDNQIGKLKMITDHGLMLRQRYKAEHENTHENFMTVLSQATLDETKLQEILDTKLDQIKSDAPSVISLIGEFYNSLNSEQQAELRDFFSNHYKKHKHHHHS